MEADDSVLLQFLIDYNQENTTPPQRALPNIEAEAEESDSDEELRRSVRAVVANRSLKTAAQNHSLIQHSDSDSDSADRILADFAQPSPFCSREMPENGGHKDAMLSMDFPPALIDRALQELGQGVEKEMLLEYLLYLTANRGLEASTSASPSRGGEDNTLAKLTKEFQFPAMAVEKAMGICSENVFCFSLFYETMKLLCLMLLALLPLDTVIKD